MIWIEMSKNTTHGGGEWDFSKCLWAPSYKQNKVKSKWLFWENILEVKKGDSVFHLQGKGHKASFIGYSIAICDGHETLEKPPKPEQWGYASSYYRALLGDFRRFRSSILLDDFFAKNKDELIQYYNGISALPKNRFFVFQSNRWQCLNGAYLSKCDNELLDMILASEKINGLTAVPNSVSTSEIRNEVYSRIGQHSFAETVKSNYNYTCCFPNCEINDKRFLIGSHIARWVDNPNKRGEISNGLCFCVFHDKAFENGYFSLNDDYQIVISKIDDVESSSVFQREISPFRNQKIKNAKIQPDRNSLAEHRFRCKIDKKQGD